MTLISSNDHELRTLRRQVKELNASLAKRGRTIHELRCELAESREINGKIARNHVRDLERQVAADTETMAELRSTLERKTDYIVELKDRLRLSDQHPVVTDARA